MTLYRPFVFIRFIPEEVRQELELIGVSAFASKAYGVYNAKTFKDADRSPRERFGSGRSVTERKLQHEVDAVFHGEPASRPLVETGSPSPLREVTAHDRNNKIGPARPARFGKVEGMAVRKRIVFSYYSCDPHFVFFLYSSLSYPVGPMSSI